MSGLLSALRLSLGLLTVAPVRPVDPTRRTVAGAILLAPLTGALLVAGAGAVLIAARLPLNRGVSGTFVLPAAIAITALVLLTRGFHLDGLADTVDGLASMRPPAAARVVMRRGDVGPSGVAAVVLALLLQTTALAVSAIQGRGTIALAIGVVTGRLAVVIACSRGIRSADRTGLGAMVAGSLRRRESVAMVAIALTLLAAFGALDGDFNAARGAVRSVTAAVAGLLAGGIVLRHCIRRLGGITGDVLGALVEVSTTTALVAIAL